MSSNSYPFVTKKEIANRIASEPAFAVECVRTLDAGSKWMASHRSRAAKLIARLAEGTPSPEDLAEAAALATPYARTLTRLAREREMVERPELVGVAAVFGIVRPVVTEPVLAEGTSVQTSTAATSVPAAPKKRRGRPPGSKNRPREEREGKRPRRRT